MDRHGARVGHYGDVWVAVQWPYLLRRYSPEGKLLWEQSLPKDYIRDLVLSPDNTLAALTMDNPQTELTTVYIYDETGTLKKTQELPPFCNNTEFLSNQELLIHCRDKWQIVSLEDMGHPRLSGNFVGATFSIIPLQSANCFVAMTAIQNRALQTVVVIQAIDLATGRILAECEFEPDTMRDICFFRFGADRTIELLFNGNMILVLRIP